MGENELHFKYKSFDFWNRAAFAAPSCGCVVMATFLFVMRFVVCGDVQRAQRLHQVRIETRFMPLRAGTVCETKQQYCAHNKCSDLAFTCKLCNRKRKIKLVKNALFYGIHWVNTNSEVNIKCNSAPMLLLRRCASGNTTTAVEEETNEIFILNWICRSRCGLGPQYSMNAVFFSLLLLCVIFAKWPACFSHSRVHMSKSIQKLWRKHEIAFIRYFDSISQQHVCFVAFCSILLLQGTSRGADVVSENNVKQHTACGEENLECSFEWCDVTPYHFNFACGIHVERLKRTTTLSIERNTEWIRTCCEVREKE